MISDCAQKENTLIFDSSINFYWVLTKVLFWAREKRIGWTYDLNIMDEWIGLGYRNNFFVALVSGRKLLNGINKSPSNV